VRETEASWQVSARLRAIRSILLAKVGMLLFGSTLSSYRDADVRVRDSSSPIVMSGSTAPLPSFENPPVSEVALGVEYSPLENWRSAHGGLYWAEIKQNYPSTEIQPPLPSQIEAFEEVFWPHPSIRVDLRRRRHGFENSSDHERPGRMIAAGRGVDNGFHFFHCLYHHCKAENVTGDRLLPTGIRYDNASVNWSRYSKPWDVIFDTPGLGIAQFVVCGLPKSLPIVLPSEDAKRYSFHPRHVPLADNYSHCEVCTFKEGEYTARPKLPETVKKEFRQIMSDRSFVLLSPSA
jgi:hypothetical protein